MKCIINDLGVVSHSSGCLLELNLFNAEFWILFDPKASAVQPQKLFFIVTFNEKGLGFKNKN